MRRLSVKEYKWETVDSVLELDTAIGEHEFRKQNYPLHD